MRASGPRVSVVLPTFNRASTLPRAIASVLSQTIADFELIVVNDGSTDTTDSVVASFRDNRIRYISEPINRGPSSARNIGIDLASGEFVAFVDSDDEWLPQMLESQINTFAMADPAVAIAVAGRVKIDSETGTILKTVLPPPDGDLHDYTIRLGWVPATVCLMIKRHLLADERFDDQLPALEELDLMIRLSRHSRFAGTPSALVRVYEHPGPRVSGASQACRAWPRLAEKHQQELCRNRPVQAEYWYRAYLACRRAGDTSSALAHLAHSIRIAPGRPKRWFLLVKAAVANM